MFEFMLDTNICIYLMRRRDHSLLDRFQKAAGRMCISSIVLGELEFGVAKSSRPAASRSELDLLLTLLPVLALDRAAAIIYGEMRAFLEQRGTPIGPNDLLIRAHARSLDLTLVTNNRREFDRMPGLKVENWV